MKIPSLRIASKRRAVNVYLLPGHGTIGEYTDNGAVAALSAEKEIGLGLPVSRRAGNSIIYYEADLARYVCTRLSERAQNCYNVSTENTFQREAAVIDVFSSLGNMLKPYLWLNVHFDYQRPEDGTIRPTVFFVSDNASKKTIKIVGALVKLLAKKGVKAEMFAESVGYTHGRLKHRSLAFNKIAHPSALLEVSYMNYTELLHAQKVVIPALVESVGALRV